MLRMSIKSLIATVALGAVVAPLVAMPADAANNGRRKKNGEIMRLGGPSNTGASGSRNSARSSGGDSYGIPGRFVSGSRADVREFFLRRDQIGFGN
jgi:hypothetical protein